MRFCVRPLIVIAFAMIATSCAWFGNSSEKKAGAPAAVTNAVMAAYPGAHIESAKPEKEEIDQYEVEFTANGKKMSADVAPDGTIIETEEPVVESDVPAAARDAIAKAAEGAKIGAYEKVTETAKPDKAKNMATKLDTPMVSYEAALTKGDMHAEVGADSNGKITEPPKWKAAKKKQEKEEKED